MNKPCPNCGCNFDRKQGNFLFWECGTWARGENLEHLSVSNDCTAIKLRVRVTNMRIALKAIYDKADVGSEIRDIAEKALK